MDEELDDFDLADLGTKPKSPKKKKTGSPKAKGKNARVKAAARASPKRGGKTGKGQRPGKLPCICCEEMRVSNSRFCKDHKRSADAMSYQAEKSDDPEAKETFDQIFADDAAMAAAVNQFSKDNPPCAKYKRKQMIDWLQYKRSYGTRVTRRDRGTDVPKTEKEFKLWCVNVKGLTEQETKDWWAKLLDSPGVDRDYEGYGGKLRLYIPNAEEGRDRLRDQYIDNRQEEGSAVDKRAKPQDQEARGFQIQLCYLSCPCSSFDPGGGDSMSV